MRNQLVQQALSSIPWNHGWAASATLHEPLPRGQIEPALFSAAVMASPAMLIENLTNVLSVQLGSSLLRGKGCSRRLRVGRWREDSSPRGQGSDQCYEKNQTCFQNKRERQQAHGYNTPFPHDVFASLGKNRSG